MATRSTASSGTDPQDPGASTDATEAPSRPGGGDRPAHDPGRRAFFLQFGRQAASAAGQVAGMADVVGRTSSALAGELLGLGAPESDAAKPAFVRAGAATEPVVTLAEPAAEHAFRSAYRLSGERLILLDQRHLPETLQEVVARRGGDVAYYLRSGLARGGPLMAQVAAYGLWLTALERADLPVEQLLVELRRTEVALAEARPSSRLLARAVERMRSVRSGLDPSTPGAELATALRGEADAIAREAIATEATLATALEAALPQPLDRPLTLLIHGGQGALVAGQLGAGVVALARARDTGREIRVFVTEGRPFMDGARLLSWELRQAGIDYRIVPDSAVAWLLAREPVDVVLARAEWIAANGDTGALVGARGLAQLAAAERSVGGPTRVVVIAPGSAFDEDTVDGAAIPAELRPARELVAYLSDTPIRTSDALVPAADVIPAELIDVLVTDRAPGA